jgi:hypothetical protein
MNGGAGLLQGAAQFPVADAAADPHRGAVRGEFDPLGQRIQQHMHAVGVAHPVERVPRSKGLDPAGTGHDSGKFFHRGWPPDLRGGVFKVPCPVLH